jgi:sulfur carrier protein ThiS
MDHDKQSYEVHAVDSAGNPGPFEAAYSTVVEVLAHCEENPKPCVIRVNGEFFSLDRFMKTHVSAG